MVSTNRWIWVAFLLACAAASWPFTASAEEAVVGQITRFDRAIDSLVGPESRLEPVAKGFHWVEGPVWNGPGRFLLFSDIPANAIYRWSAESGTSVFLERSGYSGATRFLGREPGSNGLVYDSRSRLVICAHGDRKIFRLEPDGRRTLLADRYGGLRLNSPNDAVYRANGDLYFTDPPFGLPRAFDDPAKELPYSGVYRLDRNGALSLLLSEIKAPNGIAFSPDERVLYLTDVDPARPAWLAYDVLPGGGLANGRILLDAAPFMRTRQGGPDGIKVDRSGNIFGAGPGGVYVIQPDGRLLGILETGTATSNVAWGEDCSTLFVTADQTIWRIRLRTRGAACVEPTAKKKTSVVRSH